MPWPHPLPRRRRLLAGHAGVPPRARPPIPCVVSAQRLRGAAHGVVYPGERPAVPATRASLADAPVARWRSLRRCRHGHRADRRAPRCARKDRVASLPRTQPDDRHQVGSATLHRPRAGHVEGAKRPGLSARSEAPGDRPGGPDDSPGASVSERPGAVRAKRASSRTSRPKLAGVSNTASALLEAGKQVAVVRPGKRESARAQRQGTPAAASSTWSASTACTSASGTVAPIRWTGERHRPGDDGRAAAPLGGRRRPARRQDRARPADPARGRRAAGRVLRAGLGPVEVLPVLLADAAPVRPRRGRGSPRSTTTSGWRS